MQELNWVWLKNDALSQPFVGAAVQDVIERHEVAFCRPFFRAKKSDPVCKGL